MNKPRVDWREKARLEMNFHLKRLMSEANIYSPEAEKFIMVVNKAFEKFIDQLTKDAVEAERRRIESLIIGDRDSHNHSMLGERISARVYQMKRLDRIAIEKIVTEEVSSIMQEIIKSK